MSNPIRTAALALVAAATLAGCNAPLPAVAVIAPKAGVAGTNAARGQVRVALAGLGKAYRVLATRADVRRLELRLTSHASGKVQARQVGPKELAKPMVYVDFDAVATGKATLAVDAFDAQGRAIGKGENGTAVSAGKTSTVHVNVKLDPAAGAGDVDAVITFEETVTPDPYPRDGEEAFRRADRDADGWVSVEEYVKGWPHPWGGPVIGYPTPMTSAVPVAAIEPAPTPPATSIATAAPDFVACYPENGIGVDVRPYPCHSPFDQARLDFKRRDVDRDGRLGLDEFLGRVVMY